MSSTGNFWQRHKAKIIGGVVFLAGLGVMSLYWSPYAAATEHKDITKNDYIKSVENDAAAKVIANKQNDFLANKQAEVYKSTKNGNTFGLGSWWNSFGTKYEKEDGTLDMAKVNAAGALDKEDPVFKALQAEEKRIGNLPADQRQAEMKTFFEKDIKAAYENDEQYKNWQKSGADQDKILEDYNAAKQSEATWSKVGHHAKNAGTAGALGALSALCAGKLCGGESDEKSPELTDEEKAEKLRKQKEAAEALRKKLAEQKKKEEATKNKKKKETKSSSGMIWFIVVFLLLAGGGAAAYFVYFKEDEEDEELGEDV